MTIKKLTTIEVIDMLRKDLKGSEGARQYIGHQFTKQNQFGVRLKVEEYWQSLGADYKCLTTHWDSKNRRLTVSIHQRWNDPFWKIEYTYNLTEITLVLS